jgi:hypothetical protein
LLGCAHPAAEPPHAPAAVVVRDTPPSDLLACPALPAGFPEDEQATMTPAVRTAAIRVMTAFGAVVGQLGRLVEWNSPGACPLADATR